MKVIVTGGTGFIGSNLCAALVKDSRFDDIIVLDNLSTGLLSNLDGMQVRLVECELLDSVTYAKELGGIDALVHLAARPSVAKSMESPILTHETNATGTLMLLEAARIAKIPYTIVASSSSVYGDTEVLPKHEGLVPKPRSPYAASKVSTEAYAFSYQAAFGLDVLVFRFFNVYGPRQRTGSPYAAVIPAFIHAALNRQPLPIRGDGTQSRDFTFVESVVQTILRALTERTVSSTPVNLAFGTRTSLLQLVETLGNVFGEDLAVKHEEARPGDVMHSQADSSALNTLFPNLSPTSLEEGLAKTVSWVRENQ